MLRHGLIEGWNEPYWDNYGNYHPPGDVRERALGTFLSAAIGGVAGLAGLSNPVDDLAGLVDDALPGIGDDLANAAGEESTTILGHYPEYVEISEQLGARRFQIPTEVWNKMSPAEQWAANQKFLDRTILRGDSIRLATPLENVLQGIF